MFQLQDRTQFSDADLIQLKRYWDRGMTSLGSVCKEKINAAANQLSVDTEIVKVREKILWCPRSSNLAVPLDIKQSQVYFD